MTAHGAAADETWIQSEIDPEFEAPPPGFGYRYRWECACGQAGAWYPHRTQAELVADAHRDAHRVGGQRP